MITITNKNTDKILTNEIIDTTDVLISTDDLIYDSAQEYLNNYKIN